MIFVTVGMQMPFDRLIQCVEKWAICHNCDDVLAQVGYTSQCPKGIKWVRFFTPGQFREAMKSAQVIVSHAGSGTILTAMQLGKPILVMPRREDLKETRSDHQVSTSRFFKRMGAVEVAEDEIELLEKLNGLGKIKYPVQIGPYASQNLLETIAQFIDGYES